METEEINKFKKEYGLNYQEEKKELDKKEVDKFLKELDESGGVTKDAREFFSALSTNYDVLSTNVTELAKLVKDIEGKYQNELKLHESLKEELKAKDNRHKEEVDRLIEEFNYKMQNNQDQIKKEMEAMEKMKLMEQEKYEEDDHLAEIEELKSKNEKLKIEFEEADKIREQTIQSLNEATAERNKLLKEKSDLLQEKNNLDSKVKYGEFYYQKEIESKDKEIQTIKENLNHKNEELSVALDSCKKKEDELADERGKVEAKIKEIDQERIDKSELEKKLRVCESNVAKLVKEKEDTKQTINQLKEEKKKLYELRDTLEKGRKFAEKQKIEIEGKNNNLNKIIKEKMDSENQLKSDNLSKEKHIESQKKEIIETVEKINKQKQDKDNLESTIKDKDALIELKNTEIRSKIEDLDNLGGEFKKSKEAITELEKKHHEVERARNKATEENTKLKNKIDHLLEDIKLGDNRVQELQKKVAEYEKKLKRQRDRYDAARRDKNLYFQLLIQVQDDLVERSNLLQNNKKEIENLKSDLKKKDDYIVEIKSRNQKFESDINKKERKNSELNNKLGDKTKMCQAQEKEMEKLKINVEDIAKNYNEVSEKYKKTIIERDNLSSQLIRRNDEVSILHEKIMILSTDMSKLEQKIQEEQKLIEKKETKLKDATRTVEINNKYKEKANELSKSLINKHKELLREKNLNKALTEEVESSDKLFHRWRKLEGIDPDSLELHFKISLLQKRLIGKTEECVEKEITIQDLTKELSNCKKLANKKPVFEIEESIKKYKQEVSKQYNKNKAITAELNMYRNQLEEYKADNTTLKKENVELQNKFNELKKRTSSDPETI